MKKILLLLAVSVIYFGCKHEDELLDEDTTSLKTTTITVTTEDELKEAVADASAGDVILVSGTIYLTSTLQLLNSGTSSSKINICGSSASDLGVIDCSSVSGWGVKCNGSYWNIQYLDICNAGDCGLVFQSGGNNYVYWCRFYQNGDSGFQIYNGSYSNNINYCWSFDNYDEENGGENADGFACKLSGGAGNVYNYCEATHNSDDGFDLYGQPYPVTMNYCTAMYNGYGTDGDGNGFKLGSAGQDVDHILNHCISKYNKSNGFDGNGNTGYITLTNCTGTGNGGDLFYRINE